MRKFIFDNQYKAIDTAKWFNFIERCDWNVVITNGKNKFEVKQIDLAKKKPSNWLDIVPVNYSRMGYEHIASIYKDTEPLHHMEDIKGMFSTLNNQIIQFILKEKIPLEKFIRMELANRGFDDRNDFVGFERAKECWLK